MAAVDDQNVAPDITPQMDQTGASDTPGTPGPQQAPATTAAQFPFPGSTGSPAGSPQEQPNPNQPDAQKAPQQAPQPQQPVAPAVDPAVAKASKVHSILQALSGGPHYATTIDPNTGTAKETQVPMSNAQYARSLAAAVLTGAFSGLGEKGPGAEGKAAEAGFNAALKQQQDQQAQDKLQASQTYARQAAIAHTNFQQHETAQRMGQLDYEFHKQHVADNSQTIENVKAVGADLASNVHERDLLPKYNITQAGALIDGVEPRLNEDGTQAKDQYGQPLWDNTYTVVDPNKKIQLDQDTANYAAAHRIPGTFSMVDGKAVPKDFSGSPAVRAGIVLSIKAQTAAIQTTEAQLNQQLGRLGDAGKTIEGKLDANITQAIDKNLISPKSLQTFSKYASMPFDQALDQMRKDKVDPSTIGQISQLIPQDTQAALKKQRLDTEASDKSAREASAAADKQKAELPGQIEEARLKAKINSSNAFAEGYNHEAGSQAAKTAAGVASGTLTGKLKNNDLYGIKADGPVVNGVNQSYLDQLKGTDPAIAAAVDAVGHGQAFVSNYGLAKDAGQHFLGLVHQAFPDFAVGKANEYEKQLSDFGVNGKTGKSNAAASTTLEHLVRLHDSLGLAASVGMSGEADVNKANALNEMGNFYANGNKAGENELKDYRDAFNKNPIVARQATVGAAKAMLDKVKENYNVQARAVPSTFGKPEPILSEDAANAYKQLTHETVPDYLVDHNVKSRAYANQPSSGGGTGNNSQAARAPLPGQRPNEIPQYVGGKLVGFSLPGKNGMRPVPQQ